MFRRAFILGLVALFAFGEMAPWVLVSDAYAQSQPTKKRRTLFDMLFGGDEEEEAPPAPAVVAKPKKAALPPPKPAIEKAATATRLAVFGDSLAVDLAAALGRFYEDDPNIIIVNQGVGSSGFVRADYFDWGKTATEQVAANSFDIAVVAIGINDRQNLRAEGESLKPLTDEWTNIYRGRVAGFISTIRAANKPVVWVGLPPTSKAEFSTDLAQINAIQRLAAFSGGAEFVDVYDKFVDEEGKYSSYGPDLNGNRVRMRKDDGIHYSSAGSDKLAFYVTQSIRLFYRGGGGVGITVADVLAGTDAALMVRPPYQGLGQTRLLEVAGAVIPLSQAPKRATDLVSVSTATVSPEAAFDINMMLDAPVGRVDAFGVGKVPEAAEEEQPVAAAVTAPVAPAVAAPSTSASVLPVAATN